MADGRAITHSSDAPTPGGDAYNQSEAIRRQQRVQPQLIRHQAALAVLWCFIMAAITTEGFPTALRLRERFHDTLCEASRGDVRGNTWLSFVT